MRGQHSVVCCLCVQSILQFVIQSNLNVNTFKTFKVLQKYEMNKLDGFSQNTQNKKFNCCFEFQNKRRIAPSEKTLRHCPTSNFLYSLPCSIFMQNANDVLMSLFLAKSLINIDC